MFGAIGRVLFILEVSEVRLINAKQASEILGLRLPRLYELARMRVVPFVRFGPKQIRFDPEVLAEWAKHGGSGSVEENNSGGDNGRDDDK
jgi:excisionase family DNA binding protein